MFAGAFFDVLDGLAARALGGGSELGKQLDSLADMVTFGVAPGMVLWSGHLSAVWKRYLFHVDHDGPVAAIKPEWTIALAVTVLIAASAWRLAKFNIDTRQTSGFLGLPTPANGLFWVSIVLGALGVLTTGFPGSAHIERAVTALLFTPSAVLALSIVMAVLMLSEIPLAGLKFKHFKWRGNEVIYLLLGIGAVLVVLYGMLAVPLIMVLYVLSPLLGRVFGKGVN